MKDPTILLLAGEPSGDRYGATLAARLSALYPRARLIGTGGELMEAEGVELLAELDQLTVMGFMEVIPRIPSLWRLERKIIRFLDNARPSLVVLIDYPGFNMRIARAARDRALKVIYYITPKVWAWRTARVRALAETVDRAAVILPFEEALLRRLGVDATYVGHPLLDRPDDVCGRDEFVDRWGLDPSRPLLAMLPGSRTQEIRYHLELFGRIATRVVEARPDVLPVFSRARALHAGPFHDTGYAVVDDTRGLLRHARAALVKSGTATLETAIEGTPLVVAYRMSAVTYMIARRFAHVDHIALPNLVVGERIVPEFVQDQIDPGTVGQILLELLDEESDRRRGQLQALVRVRNALGRAGASDRVAALAEELLQGQRV